MASATCLVFRIASAAALERRRIEGVERLAQIPIDAAPQRRRAVERDRHDHIERNLALDAERIEAGEQPLQRQPDRAGPSAP